MSKLLDGLNKFSKSKEKHVDPIQEELAKVFFGSSTKKNKKRRLSSKIPWIIAGISFIFVIFIVALNSNIDIKINITRKASLTKNIFFIKDGKPNTEIIKNISFLGDASPFSRKEPDMLVLVNSRGAGWANMSIELKNPMNMEGFDISYIAKGKEGKERVILVLVDRDNRSYRMETGSSRTLTNQWQDYRVDLGLAKNAIGLSGISKIQFEFGGLTCGNYPNATIFLKDIAVTKKEGTKWL